MFDNMSSIILTQIHRKNNEKLTKILKYLEIFWIIWSVRNILKHTPKYSKVPSNILKYVKYLEIREISWSNVKYSKVSQSMWSILKYREIQYVLVRRRCILAGSSSQFLDSHSLQLWSFKTYTYCQSWEL